MSWNQYMLTTKYTIEPTSFKTEKQNRMYPVCVSSSAFHRRKNATPFALIRKVGDFAGLGSQVHRTCSQATDTLEQGTWTTS